MLTCLVLFLLLPNTAFAQSEDDSPSDDDSPPDDDLPDNEVEQGFNFLLDGQIFPSGVKNLDKLGSIRLVVDQNS